jgi:uncharacterized membrane protein
MNTSTLRARGVPIARAAALGACTGARTFAASAMLALRGRLGGPRTRPVVLLLAAGELVGDKLPKTPPRTQPQQFAGRVVSGAFCGHRVAGPWGAGAAAVTAAASTLVCGRARGAVVSATGLPDPAVAVAEDLLAFGLAALATSSLEQTSSGAGAFGPSG